MNKDITLYLKSIDDALATGSPIPWIYKHQETNTILSLISSLDVPKHPSTPICKLFQCNNPTSDSDFCCTEHEEIHKKETKFRVRIIGSFWRDSTDTMKEFGVGCSDQSTLTWGSIQLVDSEPYDYTVIINAPHPNTYLDKKKTIIFHMEPNMETNQQLWGDWANPEGFLRVFKHSTDYNNLQWHLKKTYQELMSELDAPLPKKEDKVSMVISGKYNDIGHVLRWDIAHDISETDIPVVFYGNNNRFRLPNHMGALPHLNKDLGMYPYKYHIAIENCENYNYVTEKLVDGILAECLTFYWGAPNIKSIIDQKAYIHLSTNNPKEIINMIRIAIKEDWWSQRIQFIRKEKERIINQLAFIPRLEKFIKSIEE